MTEINPAGWFQSLATHTAEQLRSYIGGLLAVPSGAASLKTANGVHPGIGTAMAVTQNGTPNMSVNVGAGIAFVVGTEGTKQGTYICENDAVVNKAITASDPTLNRIDLVVCRVRDQAYSGAVNSWDIFVVNGTAAASPSAPTAPSNSLILAQIAVNAGITSVTTARITDRRPWNAALGGHVPCTSAARPSNPYGGLYGYELDTARSIRYDGTNWHQLGRHICTSGTRPSGPFTGMEIYETDTGLKYDWNGSKWMRQEAYAIKLSDEQRVSTTTPTTDSTLFFNAETNSIYIFDMGVFVFGDSAVDLKVAMVIPASATIKWTVSPSQGGGATTGVFDTVTWHGSTTLAAPGWVIGLLSNPNHSIMRVWGYVTTAGSSGVVGLQYAQNVSNASASFVEAGSYLTYKQVG